MSFVGILYFQTKLTYKRNAVTGKDKVHLRFGV